MEQLQTKKVWIRRNFKLKEFGFEPTSPVESNFVASSFKNVVTYHIALILTNFARKNLLNI